VHCHYISTFCKTKYKTSYKKLIVNVIESEYEADLKLLLDYFVFTVDWFCVFILVLLPSMQECAYDSAKKSYPFLTLL